MTKEDEQVKKRLYTRLMDVYRHNDIYIPGFNYFTRSILKLKAESHFSSISKQGQLDREVISEWLDSKNLFFGYGVFRSGTTFLADFLNRHAKQAFIQHEANVNDYWYYTKAIHSNAEAEKYIQDYRLSEIYYRTKDLNFDTYGEINPFLRRHCQATKLVLPEAKQFQIVRDPRNVLRSLMSRELLGKKDPMGAVIFPAKDDAYAEDWPNMSRFEKLCWLWASDNQLIRKTVGHTIKFETLRNDFDYFDENVLAFLNLDVNPAVWKSEMDVVYNSTPTYTFPKYSNWSTENKKHFERICGAEMAVYGY
jgi:hypothetical protein